MDYTDQSRAEHLEESLGLATTLDWVIVGGESRGPDYRRLVEYAIPPFRDKGFYVPKHSSLSAVRSLRDQCVAAGVPFFFKQWGGPTPKSGGRSLDGRTWDEYPDLAERARDS